MPLEKNNSIPSDFLDRHTNATLQAFFDSTYDGYWDWYIQDDYEYMSPRFWEMFGYLPEEKEHSPSAWQTMIFEEDLEVAIQNFQKHVESRGKHPYAQEVRYRHKNGSTVYVDCRGQVVEWDENDQPIRMIGTHTDITERRNLINELASKNEDLDQFAYTASHDLKQPLRGIAHCAEFLSEDYGHLLPKDGNDLLQRIIDLSQRQQYQVQGLLQYARLELEDTKEALVDLMVVIEDVKKDINHLLEGGNVHINVLGEALPTIQGDHASKYHIFYNLITNAIKYNDSSEKIVELSYSPESKAFSVADNGVGIPENNYEKVFKLFSQVGKFELTEDSTGIGLAIVKKLISRRGGKIWITKNNPKGSIFHFTLK